MSDDGHPPKMVENEELDNPLRAIVVVNYDDGRDGDMEEALLDSVQTFDEMNGFFDKFDEEIAIPNQDHIKYEVGSDGLVVIIVESIDLRDKILSFFEKYENENKDAIDDVKEETDRETKRSKK